MTYVCEGYETIDLICYKVFGHHDNGITSKVRTLNDDVLTGLYLSHIEDHQGFYHEVMPKGLKLSLPEEKDTAQKPQVRRLF